MLESRVKEQEREKCLQMAQPGFEQSTPTTENTEGFHTVTQSFWPAASELLTAQHRKACWLVNTPPFASCVFNWCLTLF